MKSTKCLGGLFSATDVFTEYVHQCMQEKKTFLVFLNYKRRLPGQILINDEVDEWFSNNGLYSNEPRILYRPIIDKNGVNGYTVHYSENICANILVPQTIINQPYEVFIKTVITDLERKK